MPTLPERPRPRIAAVVRTDAVAAFVEQDRHIRPLLGSPALVDDDGTIYIVTFRDDGLRPDTLHQFSPVHPLPPQADIYAPNTLYTPKILRRSEVKKDGGSVEAGIRLCYHVIDNELHREEPKLGKLENWSHALFTLFAASDFSAISDREFAAAKEQTRALLAQVGLDPARVIDRERQRIMAWVIKGSGGVDVTGRRNKLVMMTVLAAAYRHAQIKRFHVGTIVQKFAEAAEALRFERTFSRTIFEDVAEFLGNVQGHALYKYAHPRLTRDPYLQGVLDHHAWLLRQPHVKTYRPVGRNAATLIEQALKLTKEGHFDEVSKQELFHKAREMLISELKDHNSIEQTTP